MKKFINTSNYYLSSITADINDSSETGTIDVADVTISGVTLPLTGIYFIDIEFGDEDKREIFRITSRTGNTLTYDKRISPNGKAIHTAGTTASLRDFAEIINLLSSNVDNLGYSETVLGTGNELKVKVYGGRVYSEGTIDFEVPTVTLDITDETTTYIYLDDIAKVFAITTTEPSSYYVIAKVVTTGGNITELSDYRSTVISMGSGGGGGGGGHTVKDTERDSNLPVTTYTQRDTMAFKKFGVSDDTVNLQTIVENQWLGTPDVIPVGDTVYVDEDTQMVVEGGVDIQGTLVMDGKLVVL